MEAGMEYFLMIGILLAVVISLPLFAIAIQAHIKMKKYKKISGKVIGMQKENVDVPEGGAILNHYQYMYEYNGKEYRIEDKGAGFAKSLKVGDVIDIYIKEDNPEVFLYPNFVRDKDIFKIIAWLALIPLIISIILLFIK